MVETTDMGQDGLPIVATGVESASNPAAMPNPLASFKILVDFLFSVPS
jgi:hypothetical protein